MVFWPISGVEKSGFVCKVVVFCAQNCKTSNVWTQSSNFVTARASDGVDGFVSHPHLIFTSSSTSLSDPSPHPHLILMILTSSSPHPHLILWAQEHLDCPLSCESGGGQRFGGLERTGSEAGNKAFADGSRVGEEVNNWWYALGITSAADSTGWYLLRTCQQRWQKWTQKQGQIEGFG